MDLPIFYTLLKIFEEKTSSGATTKPFGSMPRCLIFFFIPNVM